MPRKDVRKQNIKPRAAWREEDLRTAINKIKSKELSINSASKRYNIPSRTLRRRLESNNLKKITLGKPPALGEYNEIRLVKHIKKTSDIRICTEFYILLKNTLEKFDLVDKPRSIYNMDESGIQINNKPGKVVAEKGSKCVHVLTSKERGENVSVIACANAEGTFLPPVLILKGVRKNM